MKKTVNFLFPGKKLHEGTTKKIYKGSFAMTSPPFAVVLFIAPHPSTSGTASLGRLFLSRRLSLPQTSAMRQHRPQAAQAAQAWGRSRRNPWRFLPRGRGHRLRKVRSRLVFLGGTGRTTNGVVLIALLGTVTGEGGAHNSDVNTPATSRQSPFDTQHNPNS